MFGGLKKSASRLALVAAAGALSTGAFAADLGGDCCADLEERVAELEATTARKGNRKVSLTISGQVNRAIMYYNDGSSSNTYFGLDNSNSSTRFGFAGSAKVTPTVTAGFSLLIDVGNFARTYTVSQSREDGTAGDSAAATQNGDHFLRLRDANWYLDSASFGRVTVGRMTTSGVVAGIDLAGVQVVASSSPGLVGGGLLFRDAAGALTKTSLNNITDGGGYPTTRGDGLKYTTPTFAGFQASASIAEAAEVQTNAITAGSANQTVGGRNLGVQLTYAGEFSGVRIAAGLGWERFEGNGDGVLNTAAPAAAITVERSTNIGGSLALMHVPTGLFVQGDYMKNSSTGAGVAAAANNLTNYAGTRDATRWLVQGGISQNWFGIGKTALYLEYGKAAGWQDARALNAVAAGDSVTWYGLGMVQTVDAAAMDLYLGWRNFTAKNACVTAVTAAATAACVTGATKDIDVVMAGARIRF